MKMFRKLLFVAAAVLLASCSGGGGGDGGGGGGGGGANLDVAKTLLSAGDIAGAKKTYTEIIEGFALSVQGKTATKEFDPNNAEARFGRALCNMMLLIEKDPFTAILAGFGQGPWKTTDVFGANGFFAKSLEPEFVPSYMPFYNTKECKKNGDWRNRCILSKAVAGYTAEKMASSLNEMTPYIDQIIADLEVAIATQGAIYTIPKALYSGDIDIPINHADMVMILSGMYMNKASIYFANSWDFGIDLSTIVDSVGNGKLTKQQAVDLLNAQFGLKASHKLTDAKTNMQKWIDYSRQGLGEIIAGSSAGVLNLSDANKPIYLELKAMMDSANGAMGAATQIVDISPAVTANMDNFFKDPPDAGKIEIDPFVLSADGKRIQAVEGYWAQMISKACDFKLGTKGTKVFSSAVRQIVKPYHQLFSVILGHTFGKYKAGQGI